MADLVLPIAFVALFAVAMLVAIIADDRRRWP